MKTILIHGLAGSGKDTQVELLMKKYSVERIATGEMFRSMAQEGDSDAKEIISKVDQGLWPNPEETYGLFAKYVKRFDNTKDWILVGVVRYADQIPYLDRALEENGRKLDKVVLFDLSEEVVMDRLGGRKICNKCQSTYHPKYKPEQLEGKCDKCGSDLVVRKDDQPEAIKKRLQQHAETIKPWKEEYQKRGILIEIDAAPSIEEVHKSFLKALELE